VLVIENNSRITAVFKNDNGAPKIVMTCDVDVMIESNSLADQKFVRDMQMMSGQKESLKSSLFAQELNENTLNNIDDVATRILMKEIMLEDEKYQKERRMKALNESNAEIANSTEFGFQSNLMNLTKLGPKIRLRKKIKLPKEWTNPKVSTVIFIQIPSKYFFRKILSIFK
jgi:hypothetical protein